MPPKPDTRRTRIPRDIAPEAAFADALAVPVDYARDQDARKIAEAAAAYAAETMRPALGALAVRVADAGPVCSGPWTAEACGTDLPDTRAVRVRSPETGALYLLAVTFRPEFTPEARTEAAALTAQVEEDRRTARMSRATLVVGEVTGVPALNTAAARALAALRADPDAYAPIAEDTAVRQVRVTALSPDGVPTPLLDQQPALRTLTTRLFIPNRSRFAQVPDPVLPVLSEILRAAGLETRVTARNAEVGQTAWSSTGITHFTRLEEAGHAAVCAAGGMFDATVSARIAAFRDVLARAKAEITS